ncbi:pupal cuticle protein-like [Cydia fagiglandana]|uniref:pupal cuticle protein-like n=1 Tax=Cydia fagiglandana TaxID=1458189 RepID=UPI002FEDFE9D
MNPMIVFACLALACGAQASQGWAGPPANIALSQDGRNILDTPEVAQARAAHLSALQQAAQNNPNPQDDGSYDPRWDSEEYWQRAEQPKWNAAPAQQWNAPAHNQWNAAPAQQWNAAPAHNQWNAAPAWNAAGPAPAPVAETPEVAQARAAHLAALSAAKSAAPAQQWNAAPAHNQWNAAPAQQWNAAPAHNQWNGAPSWQGAPQHQAAQIRLANDGSGILDTPEVAAARAAHLAAHQQAAHAAPPQHAPQQHW